MNYKNISLTATGQFREKRKDAAEGYIAEPWEMGDKSGTSYVKYHTNLKGKLTRMVLSAPAYNENLLQLSISIEEDADNVATITIPYLDYKGIWLSDWVTAIAPILGSLKEGMNIECWLNSKTKDKSDRLYKNIYFKNVDTGEYVGVNFTREDVPNWTSTVEKHPRTKIESTVWNRDANNDFLVEKIEEAIATFGTTPTTTTQSEAPKATTAKKEAVVVEEENDDLPFG